MQSLSVVVPSPVLQSAAALPELPLTVLLVSVVVPPSLYRPPPLRAGGVAADGGVGQRGVAVVFVQAAAVSGCVAADGGVVSVIVPYWMLHRPPPSLPAVFPLTVQSVSCRLGTAAVAAVTPPVAGGVSAEVQLVRLVVPLSLSRPPPFPEAELPLTVQLVSVVVPPSLYRPPPFEAEPPVMVEAAEGQP